MKKERKEDSFIKQPYYKGGDRALEKFIQTHLNYPEKSRTEKIEGDVHIRYDINHKGDVIDTKIIGGLDDACNEEAIRVVKMLKFIVPKTPRHLKVTFHKTIRIHFHIHDQKVKNYETERADNNAIPVQYNITYQQPTKEENKPQHPVTYHYTISM